MIPEVPSHLDGNAAAGALHELFAVDVTTAHTRCSGCGHVAAFAESRLYMDAPGMVARCANCDAVLLRAATTPTGTYLDLRGLTSLKFPTVAE
jgi:phage FluMu protein Com